MRSISWHHRQIIWTRKEHNETDVACKEENWVLTVFLCLCAVFIACLTWRKTSDAYSRLPHKALIAGAVLQSNCFCSLFLSSSTFSLTCFVCFFHISASGSLSLSPPFSFKFQHNSYDKTPHSTQLWLNRVEHALWHVFESRHLLWSHYVCFLLSFLQGDIRDNSQLLSHIPNSTQNSRPPIKSNK